MSNFDEYDVKIPLQMFGTNIVYNIHPRIVIRNIEKNPDSSRFSEETYNIIKYTRDIEYTKKFLDKIRARRTIYYALLHSCSVNDVEVVEYLLHFNKTLREHTDKCYRIAIKKESILLLNCLFKYKCSYDGNLFEYYFMEPFVNNIKLFKILLQNCKKCLTTFNDQSILVVCRGINLVCLKLMLNNGFKHNKQYYFDDIKLSFVDLMIISAHYKNLSTHHKKSLVIVTYLLKKKNSIINIPNYTTNIMLQKLIPKKEVKCNNIKITLSDLISLIKYAETITNNKKKRDVINIIEYIFKYIFNHQTVDKDGNTILHYLFARCTITENEILHYMDINYYLINLAVQLQYAPLQNNLGLTPCMMMSWYNSDKIITSYEHYEAKYYKVSYDRYMITFLSILEHIREYNGNIKKLRVMKYWNNLFL